MAEGISTLTRVLDSADVRSSVDFIRALGADVALDPGTRGLHGTVTGWGGRGPRVAANELQCGNSGTTCRLGMGIVAGWPIRAFFTGDDSLSTRPMRRIATPLEKMGADIDTTEGHLPVTVHGGALTAIDYASPVASAQVKSAILLAGLSAMGTTRVTEPALSRDHTERLLPMFGVRVHVLADDLAVELPGPQRLLATTLEVPGDPSSAAFHAAAATIVGGSQVRLEDISLNVTRTGYLQVLERMGADIEIDVRDPSATEPTGTVYVSAPSRILPTTVTAQEVPSLIDEIPILAVVAGLAEGVTRFEGVGELRVKESDRLAAIEEGLLALGAGVEIEDDVLSVRGVSAFSGAVLDSLGDHRLAMAWAVAGLRAGEPVRIERFDAVDVSYPAFLSDLESLRG
jgi:3-phosphoshikimate 1-carboxyvinyltransferase